MSSLWGRRASSLPRATGWGRSSWLSSRNASQGERSGRGVCGGNEWHFKTGRKRGKKRRSRSRPRLVAPPVTSNGRGQRESRGSLAGRRRRRLIDIALNMALAGFLDRSPNLKPQALHQQKCSVAGRRATSQRFLPHHRKPQTSLTLKPGSHQDWKGQARQH